MYDRETRCIKHHTKLEERKRKKLKGENVHVHLSGGWSSAVEWKVIECCF